MSSLYEWLLALHVLAVIAWLGAGMAAMVITMQAMSNPAWPPVLATFGKTWFPVASLAAAVTGVLVWIDGPWAFGDLWILLAVGGWLASGAIGSKLGPSVGKWAGGDTAGRDAYLRLTRIDLTILVLVVVDMVVKPGL